MKTTYFLVGVALSIGLGGCANKAAEQQTAPLSTAAPRLGSTLETILAAQVANPEAYDATTGPQVTDGQRAVLAVQSYQKGQTKALVRERTSSSTSKSGGQ
jgi:hypothetical protein